VRRLTFVLSLATVAVGLWLIFRVHAVDHVCSTLSSPLTGSGLAISCQNVLSFYFLGFVLTVGGLMVLALALLAMAKDDRAARRASAVVAQRRIAEHKGLRDAA
jgi:hypothetical protein